MSEKARIRRKIWILGTIFVLLSGFVLYRIWPSDDCGCSFPLSFSEGSTVTIVTED